MKFAPCQISLEFGDGEYLFKLRLKQIAELQEKCGTGIGAIFERVITGRYRIEDCVETIRLGLIGGGLGAVEAKRLVDRYCDGNDDLPKEFLWNHAVAILAACVRGYEAPDADKKKEPSETATDSSTSPKPTRTSRSSAGTRSSKQTS